MKHDIKLAVVGCGIVGGGILHSWHHRGYRIEGFDVDGSTIARLRDQGFRVNHIDDIAVCTADILFVAISTPQSEHDGSIYLEHMREGLQKIGPWLAQRAADGHYPMIVMRSTMLPKLSEREIIPALELHSSLRAGINFGYAHMPEILRETDANEDESNIWQVVIGALDERTGDALTRLLGEELGPEHERLMSVVPVDVAEASKILLNTYNATVISFYNQMGMLLEQMGIDAQQAIDLSVRMSEGVLNCWYGTAHGYPYGGKCLPKDVAATLALAAQEAVTLPQLLATRQVNDMLLEMANDGYVPLPVKGGFRRMSAAALRAQALQAYEHYHKAIYGDVLIAAAAQAQANGSLDGRNGRHANEDGASPAYQPAYAGVEL